ncbi:hypothetical protein [Silicimonas sp. MF1-12-2]|uniref:hypothetical protein n=1 Tax=Silicimonas sp. MF1-12-2 TaxID=3384793 RepID=UPI0039B435DA
MLVLVPAHAIGGWYFTDMLTALNLILILLAAPHLSRLTSPRAALMVLPFLAIATFAAARNANLQVKYERPTSYTVVFKELCQNSAALRARLKAVAEAEGIADIRIIDTADGACAYCMELPALGLTGLGDSLEYLADRRASSLFEAAAGRGHVFVGSSPVKYAAYPLRETAAEDGYSAPLLFAEGLVEFWKIELAQ